MADLTPDERARRLSPECVKADKCDECKKVVNEIRAAVAAETERRKPWLQHKSNCGKCEDPQCGDSTWDHFCGETSDCTCGFAAALPAPDPRDDEEHDG